MAACLPAFAPGIGGAAAADGTPAPVAAVATQPDTTAVERFWPLYQALRADRPVDDALWDRLFSTPAWQALGPTRQQQARERYALAFRPSREAGYRAAIAAGGYEARVLRHLRAMVGREERLRAQAIRLPLASAMLRAREFLPHGIALGPPPVVALAVYEPDGYGTDIVVLDPAFAADLGAALDAFLAHELHHAYQGRIARPLRRPPPESSDAPVLDALLQLQREGIADLIDKRPSPTTSALGMRPGAAERYAQRLRTAPEALAAVDRHLQRMGDAGEPERLALANAIRWKLLPDGGHAAGFHMASTILRVSGKARLLSTLCDPFAFVRAYDDAVGHGPGGFGAPALAFLAGLERRVAPAPPAPPAPCPARTTQGSEPSG